MFKGQSCKYWNNVSGHYFWKACSSTIAVSISSEKYKSATCAEWLQEILLNSSMQKIIHTVVKVKAYKTAWSLWLNTGC